MTVCWNRTTTYRIAALLLASLCSMGSMLMLEGCAGSMGTMRPDPATAPVTSFDGSYRSTIRVTSSANEAKGAAWCVTPGQPIITVANGQFSYTVPHPDVPGSPATTFQAAVAQDGSFAGSANDGTISGQVSGTHMEGSINGAACIYAFTADRM